MSKNNKKIRECLRCDEKFQSNGIFNRICSRCQAINNRTNAGVYMELTTTKSKRRGGKY
jgi:Zn finger protein HypA/HybF involved in hydrogenase expression